MTVASAGDSTIKNGTITGWTKGMDTLVNWDDPVGGPVLVDRVSFRDNDTGLDDTGDGGVGANAVTITRSTFTNNRVVAVTAEMARVDINHTIFADNGAGYVGDTGSRGTFTDTRFVSNDRALVVIEAGATVERSTFIDNPNAVVSAGVVSGLIITDSRFTGSEVAVTGRGAILRITGSTLVGNTTAVVAGRFGGTIASNTFRANQTTVAFVTEELWEETVVQDNTFRLNGDGLLLENAHMELVSIGGNDARRNTGWGIYAPGATDLGGNTAKHNGTEPQCVGVVCP
ncbi:right-handed parallel beta-helix repeat-containing protein [Cellulomonas humilata]|uniref:Right handed beta helix domain-containing protein n=1 Tax=Cellulomonas humilata TaxID=144055 RepID=A0ABU0EFI3_9CELL|nr:right-handed parallel beta-helix repeat-containing protein [Cellulomonas humilata]MDQ0373853.1 hypothetical protein [Cellulomonas humilata]